MHLYLNSDENGGEEKIFEFLMNVLLYMPNFLINGFWLIVIMIISECSRCGLELPINKLEKKIPNEVHESRHFVIGKDRLMNLLMPTSIE